jgi:uncharacterized protein
MTSPANVAEIIKLNQGSLVGKTRLQKTFYFLEILGVGFGFPFKYHHYGPYSEELDIVADDAAALRMIGIEWGHTQDGAKYAVFRDNSPEYRVELNETNRKRLDILRIAEKYSAVELELAATTDYLFRHGYSNDPWSEMRRRKSEKVTDLRLDRADQLLRELWARGRA